MVQWRSTYSNLQASLVKETDSLVALLLIPTISHIDLYLSCAMSFSFIDVIFAKLLRSTSAHQDDPLSTRDGLITSDNHLARQTSILYAVKKRCK